MTKFLVAVIIILSAGGLFLYSQQAEAPTLPASEQTGEGNPFGEGSTVIGELETEDPNDDKGGETPDGTDSPVAPNEESTTAGVTRTQLAAHKTQGDCWVAYKGVVYDITAWLPRHPGSAAAIAPYCGTAEEFAAAFSRQHGSGKDGRLKREGVEKGPLTE